MEPRKIGNQLSTSNPPTIRFPILDDIRSKVCNAHQGKFGPQGLNVVPCKYIGLKHDDQQHRISAGLRLGANICVAHTCHGGKRVERFTWLSRIKCIGRFSRYATLNSLTKQTLGSLDLPSMLELRGLYRTDGKRSDGVTMIPWEMGKQLVLDVKVVDALTPSRLNQGSSCNSGTTAIEAEARKNECHRELIDNGYIFQPVAMEERHITKSKIFWSKTQVENGRQGYRSKIKGDSFSVNIFKSNMYNFAKMIKKVVGHYGVCTLALTVAKTSFHYYPFAICVPASSLPLFDLA